MKVLVIGVTGMLGNAVFRTFLNSGTGYDVVGTARSESAYRFFDATTTENIITGVDVENHDLLVKVFAKVRPQIVINCVGLVKQLAEANDPLLAVPLNTLLPHRLAALCSVVGARLIHISTDCVFSGEKGNYLETDFPDGKDLYGRSKLLGEVNYTHTITLRTSIIGHELSGSRSLIGWFISQKNQVKGFTRAIFSGLPTVELARVIHDFVLPRPNLHGLYHVAAKPIDKYQLLKFVAEVYDKKIEIVPDDSFVIDRSLNAQKFYEATGYVAPQWEDLITRMYEFK
ncbi:SDR family oxidoreductase [Nostoc sphaeroides CHAB 2801]|uniref:dTDP-4-dehydrorhamnose reductase family protein n=1 Tax=Nostoc sphaeroides TaxID=446679 RepID=UPI000E493481|nr:SDR family oxidoreductase [Nostoc sphaeroides]MCC5629685.1 SDR family oxidoreductase [Nostoc sphaeroides CHAB 2801]